MSTQNQNQNGYMLLFRGTDLRKGLSPEELQKVTDNWMNWFKRLTEEGKAVAGNPLEREVKIVAGKDRVVSDGRFAESKPSPARRYCSPTLCSSRVRTVIALTQR